MSGSTTGTLFTVTTWGESHGPGLGCVIDGCPAGLKLSEEDIQPWMDRRKPGGSPAATARKEADTIKILSGVFEGITTGTPIALMLENTDQHSKDYGDIAECFRPGHADFCFDRKFGIRDYRGGGRSSGRETAARVAAGAVAYKLLREFGMDICAYTKALGNIAIPDVSALSPDELRAAMVNPVGMPDSESAKKALALLEGAKAAMDSLGGAAHCHITGVPAGLGQPVFDKLDALLGKALFSIGAVKAVEIGEGIRASALRGSENNDECHMENGRPVFESNHAGGILGGISNGNDIELDVYFKPTPSIAQPQSTIDKNGNDRTIEIKGRHDPVIVPRALVVIEAMCALTLADALLINTASRLDSLKAVYSQNV
ncbi:MAG: chorismate synthase [Lachnospiraceae bacterium]|nr:chorismate synthase [Lachnospiraceae bacterium]